ncbi:MAG TPA: LamG domain-containing protein [Candidatus Aenigmarchaeota archaeon]|nr:LamG domain-containing protein [Candidatus Aenigmarchaeota archaeon]
MNVDIVIAIGIFITMVSLLLYLTVQYVNRLPIISRVSEYREKAKRFFESLFESEGSPENWEKVELPSQIGLERKLYRIPLLVADNSGISRINEFVKVDLIFDDKCKNKTWNNTVRIFDDSFNEIPFKFAFQNYCNEGYISNATLTIKVNVSGNSKKKLFVYYSNDESVEEPNYTDWDLVLYLPFDEGTGNVAWDYSGYNNTGILNENVSWAYGKFGNAVNFDGSPNYVIVKNPLNLATFTLGFWIKPSKDGREGQAIMYNKLDDDFWLRYNYSSSLFCVYSSRWNPPGYHCTNEVAEDSKWSFCAISFNTTHVNLYVNGNLDKSIQVSYDGNYIFDSETYIGGAPGENEPFFNGTIDEVKVWNRALSNEEIVSKNFTQPLLKIFPEQSLELISPSKLDALRKIEYEKAKSILGENYEFRLEVNPVE